ncbi:hypothetical protein [Brevundimonas sp. FT23028]|uniref:hypothetical protein n=1 Tax=Brevundimonas sp. FT23028 TaxID=3393748 RepID=UPI003B586345
MGAEAVSFAEDLISTLGKDTASAEVAEVTSRYGLADVYDDPPLRIYVGSSTKGVDLLSESGKVLDVQFFVQRSETHAPFSDELPFGIKVGMSDADIHRLLGEPDIRDFVGSKYLNLGGNINVTVVYDGSNVVSYLSVRKA